MNGRAQLAEAGAWRTIGRGSAAVPPASLPSASLDEPSGGETPPELAAETAALRDARRKQSSGGPAHEPSMFPFVTKPRAGFAEWAGGLCLLLFATISPSGQAQPEAPPSTGTNPVVLSFQLRRGHVLVPARVNGLEPRWFMLDTGYGTTMLSHALAETLALRRAGHITIVGIAGEERANLFEGPTFDLAGAAWSPRRVAAFPASDEGRGRQRDGIFGSSFFRRFVVEIDSTTKVLRLYDPDGYKYSGSGEVLPLSFKGSTPIVEASVGLPDKSSIQAQFEIDTGCTGGLCIGRHFVEAHQLVPTNSLSQGRRFGVGGGMRTRSGRLPRVQLGRLVIEKPEADFFLDGSPVDPPRAGHIGWELLRNFRIIFDYRRKQMILEQL